MSIKNKWKVFSIGQNFSHDPTNEEAVALFDALSSGESINEDAVRWEPFEYMDADDFMNLVIDTARSAQMAEGNALELAKGYLRTGHVSVDDWLRLEAME